MLELAGLTVWLPDGSALWRSMGGTRAESAETRHLRMVEFRLRELAWQKTKDGQDGRNRPKPPEPPPVAGAVRFEEAHAERQARARARRGSQKTLVEN